MISKQRFMTGICFDVMRAHAHFAGAWRGREHGMGRRGGGARLVVAVRVGSCAFRWSVAWARAWDSSLVEYERDRFFDILGK